MADTNRTLLVNLALATEGLDRIAALEKNLKDLREQLQVPIRQNIEFEATGLKELRAQLTQLGAAGGIDRGLGRQLDASLGAMIDNVGKLTGNVDIAKRMLEDLGKNLRSAFASGEAKIEGINSELAELAKRAEVLDKLGALGTSAVGDIKKSQLLGSGLSEQQARALMGAAGKDLDAMASTGSETPEAFRAELSAAKAELAAKTAELTARLNEEQAALEKNKSAQQAAATAATQVAQAETRQAAATTSATVATEKETVAAKAAATAEAALRGEIDQTNQSIQKQDAYIKQLHDRITQLSDKLSKAASSGDDKKEKSLGETFLFRLRSLGIFASAAAIIFPIINLLRRATREAIDFQQQMADIQAVLPSKGMNDRLRIEEAVIDSARRYGVSLQAAAESAKFFAQAGFTSGKDITAAMEASLRATRGAGLSPDQAQSLILSVRAITDDVNTNIERQVEALDILDRIARVEARRSVTAKDLVDAITRVGPIAHQLRGDMIGVADSFDLVMAATTGIVERTRVSGSNAATSLRFIFARLGAPEVLKNLQETAGVRLARDEEGKQLRPLMEIMSEIVNKYTSLMESGETGKAMQLLTVLGGARQLSATTALMQSWRETVLNTSRDSSLALGDMSLRTEISMDTIKTSMEKAYTGIVTFTSALLEFRAVGLLVKGTFDLLAGVFGGIGSMITSADESLYQMGIGRNRMRVRGLTQDEINESPRVQEFRNLADQAGMRPAAFFEELRSGAMPLFEQLSAEIGERGLASDVQDLIDKFDSGKTEARAWTSVLEDGEEVTLSLREAYGRQLIEAFREADPEVLGRMAEALEDMEPSTERNTLLVEAQARAYFLLANAVYASNAAFESNNQRIRETIETIQGDIEGKFSGSGSLGSYLTRPVLGVTARRVPGVRYPGTTNPGVLAGASARGVNTDGTARNFPSMSAYDQAMARTGIDFGAWGDQMADAMKDTPLDPEQVRETTQVLEQFRSGIINGLGRDLKPIYQAMYDNAGGMKAWNDAIQTFMRDPAATQFGQFLDMVATNLDAMSETDRASLVQDMAKAFESQAELGNIEDISIIGTNTPGFKYVEEILELTREYIEEAIKMRGEAGGNADELRRLLEALSSPAAHTAFMTEVMSKGFRKLSDDLADLIGQFWLGERAASRFDEIFNGLGAGFDPLQARLRNARTFVESLSSIADDMYLRLARSQGAQDRLQTQLTDINPALGEFDVGTTDGANAFINRLSTAQTGAFQRQMQDVVNLRREVERLGGPIMLAEIYGNSEEGNKIIDDVIEILTAWDETGQLMFSDFQRLGVLLPDLKEQAGKYYRELLLQEDSQRRQVRLMEHVHALQTAELSFRQELANATTDESDNIAIQLEMVSHRIDLERSQLEIQLEHKKIGDIAFAQQMEALKMKEHEQRVEVLMLNVARQRVALQKQGQENLLASLQGVSAALTDPGAFVSGTADNRWQSILGPVAETFSSRIVENLGQDLSENSRIGRALGKFWQSPERMMEERLQTAITTAGMTAAQAMGSSIELAGAKVAGMWGMTGTGSVPLGKVQRSGGFTGWSIGAKIGGTSGTSGTGSSANWGRWEDFTSLAAPLAVTGGIAAMSDKDIGGGTAMGAQIGGMLGGAALGTAWGSAAAPIIGTVVGALVGGLAGMFLDPSDDDREERQTRALETIERNTASAAQILEAERKLFETARGIVNIPSSFTVPAYGGSGVSIGTIQFSPTLVLDGGQNPEQILGALQNNLGQMFRSELRKLGVGR